MTGKPEVDFPTTRDGSEVFISGKCTVLPRTLRAVFMDLADQLRQHGFRWIVMVHFHGDPAHNRMLDQAGEYFHEHLRRLNLFGYLWAMALKDFRTPEQQKQDGVPKHATMTDTRRILALEPLSPRTTRMRFRIPGSRSKS